jgi:WD40 repeat protein
MALLPKAPTPEPLEPWEERAPRRSSRAAPLPVLKCTDQLFPATPAVRIAAAHSGADVVSLSWTADAQLLSAGLDGTVALWCAQTGKCLRRFAMPAGVSCVAAHPSRGNFFVCGALDSKLRVWNAATGAIAYSKSTGSSAVTAVAFTRDGSTVVVGLASGTVQVCVLQSFYLLCTTA